MIVSMSIDDLKNDEIKGVYDGKNIYPYIEVVCDSSNLRKTLDALLPVFNTKKTKIVNVSYKGEISYLEEVLFSSDYSVIPVVLKKKLSEIEYVDLLVASLPKYVNIVIKIDMEVANIMTVVHGYSLKYDNISFCGGNLIALKGCRLGCTEKGIRDLSSKEGCYMGYSKIALDDIEEIEYIEASRKPQQRLKKEKVVKEPKATKVKVVKEPKPKKDKVVKATVTKGVSSILARRLTKGE